MKNLAQIQDTLSDDDIKTAKELVTKWGKDKYHVGAWPFISIDWYIKTLELDGAYIECRCPGCALYRKLGGAYSPIIQTFTRTINGFTISLDPNEQHSAPEHYNIAFIRPHHCNLISMTMRAGTHISWQAIPGAELFASPEQPIHLTIHPRPAEKCLMLSVGH